MKKVIEKLEKSLDIQEDILLEMQAETRKKEYDIKQMTKLAGCLKLLEKNNLKDEDAEWFFDYFLEGLLYDELGEYFFKTPLQVEHHEESGDGWNEPRTGGFTDYGFNDFILETESLTDYISIPLKFEVKCIEDGVKSDFRDDCCIAEITLSNIVYSAKVDDDGDVYEIEFKEVK